MTTDVQTKFSILIPTRNGFQYLPYAVDSVLSQQSSDFELIVSDNHSSDGTAEYLDGLADKRLVKLKPPSELPMTPHFEYILSHARGEWVTIVGDDDGLMPFFFDHLREFGLDSVKSPAIAFRRAYYFWKGCEELASDAVVSYNPSNFKRYVDNRVALLRALCLGSDYMQMPQTYTTGLVRSDFIRAVTKKSGGRFFHAHAPDAASAATLALNAPRHLRVEQPLFWTGTSPKSVGYSAVSSTLKQRVDEFNKQNEERGLRLSGRIPSEMRKKLDLSVLLYDSVLQCPQGEGFWSSAPMKWLFIAGQYFRGGEARDAVLATSQQVPFFWLKAAPFLALIALLKSANYIHQRILVARRSMSRDPRLRSNDRTQFPTIKEASDAVLKLYREAHPG